MKFAKRLLQAMRGGAEVIRPAGFGESAEDLAWRQAAKLASMGTRALCPTRGTSAVPAPRYVTPAAIVGQSPERPLPVLADHDPALELSAEQVQAMVASHRKARKPRHLRVVD